MNKVIPIVIVIILIISGIAGYYYFMKEDEEDVNNGKEEEKIHYELYMTIENVNSSFYITVPAPVYNHNKSIIYQIINESRIENGFAGINIENTKYGSGINLSAENGFNLISEGYLDWLDRYSTDFPPMNLNLISTYDMPNWVIVSEEYFCYSSIENITLGYSFKISNWGFMFKWEKNNNSLQKGWNIINLIEDCAIS